MEHDDEMVLRDMAALLALNGMLAARGNALRPADFTAEWCEAQAAAAYKMADAMMKVRKEK